VQWLDAERAEHLRGSTQLMIVPGYPFQVCEGLVTNFHQPESTLLLLVAAFIGDDWQLVYDYALAHEFRFLSYGDASLLWRRPA
jgi:S-adenosylmethionine:tRNA ribosyltransferase-isomerase